MSTVDTMVYTRIVELAGNLLDPSGPSELHPLQGGSVPVSMYSGLYIAVDNSSTCHYVGMIHRSHGGVAERLKEHRWRAHRWSAVWLLPLKANVARRDVLELEACVIRLLNPAENVVHARRWTA
jgi:hypothetical protein